jgi:hypothetical protein
MHMFQLIEFSASSEKPGYFEKVTHIIMAWNSSDAEKFWRACRHEGIVRAYVRTDESMREEVWQREDDGGWLVVYNQEPLTSATGLEEMDANGLHWRRIW